MNTPLDKNRPQDIKCRDGVVPRILCWDAAGACPILFQRPDSTTVFFATEDGLCPYGLPNCDLIQSPPRLHCSFSVDVRPAHRKALRRLAY